MTKLNSIPSPLLKILSKYEHFFLFATLLLLPTQLGKHFWPDFTYIYSLRTDYLSPVLYLWDLLVIVLLAVFLIRGGRFHSTSLFVFLLFIFAQLLSIIAADNVGASLVRVEQFLIIGFWGVYILSQRYLTIKSVLWVGIGGAIIWSGLLAIIEFLLGRTVGFWFLGERSFSLTTVGIATFNWYGQVFLRPYATFPHPNVLAAFLLIGLIIIEFSKPVIIRGKSLFFYYFAFIVGSSALFLTFSRVGVGLFGLFLLYLLRKRLRVLGLIFLLLLPFLYVRYSSAFNFDQLSIIRREELAVQAIELWQKSPILGVGLNNFVYRLADGSLISGEVRFLQPVHNIFLLSLAETGVVGLVSLLGLFISGINRLLSFGRRYPLLLYGWVAIFVFGMFDHFFLTLGQGIRLFFLYWALSMIHLSGEVAEKNI